MTTIRPPAHVEPYVRILGEDLAIEFLLTFGGARRQLSASPQAESAVVRIVGIDRARALHGEFGLEIPRVPTGKIWIAQVWHLAGVPVSEIARRLHMTDKTVRGWTKPNRAEARRLAEERAERRAAEAARQGDLIDRLDAAP